YQHGVDMVRPNHGASTDFDKSVKHSFDVLRENVESFRCGDDIFLAASEVQPSVGINLPEVTGMKPFSLCRCDVLAAYQNFAVGRDHYILTLDNLSERTRACVKRMIDCNDRAGFSQSIPLDNGEPLSFPELFKFRIDTRAAYHESPELPSKSPMDSPMT